MKAYAWPRPPIIIAIVLGKDVVEKWMSIATQAYGWEMFERWQFLAIIGVVVFGGMVGLRVQRTAARSQPQSAPAASDGLQEVLE